MWVITIFLIIMAFIGAPLFAVIGAGALLGFYFAGIDLSVVAIEIYRITDTSVLLAIPLFTFAGFLLSESKAAERLVQLTDALLGWLHGGLAVVTIIACAFFTALTGASGVTIIALGALLYPALRKTGYQERFSLGLITSSGSLGLLFPPSIAVILYGIVAQQLNVGKSVTINDLFIAGIFPGVLMIVLLIGWSEWQSRNMKLPKKSFSKGQIIAALKSAKWEIPLPFVILGGIYSGLFAISEAAVVSVLYVFIVEVLIQKEISLKQFPEIVRESMVMVGGILIILGISMASTNYLIDTELPYHLFEFFKTHVDSQLTFLILLNIFLLALGMMLDIFSAIVIVVPLILPVAVSYGVHPVHLGIIFLANMQIGYFTPPVGMNLFIASYRFNKPVMELYRSTLPFMAILLIALMIITYWPGLSMILLQD